MARLPDYDDALNAALDPVEALGVEEVDLASAADRVLAEPIVADRDLPPYDRAMMDGYAVRASEVSSGVTFPVAATIPAGASPDVRVPPGQCVKIATGAAVPEGLDAVIQHEWSDRGDPVAFTVASISPSHAIHARGADARQGNVVLEPGTVMRGQHLGIAATVGRERLTVTRRPRVTILTSGDEVRAVGEPIETHQIRNSNGPMLLDLLQRFGAGAIEHQHLPDEREVTIDAMRAAIGSADLVITVGGVSVGERDYFPAAYDECKVDLRLRGAAIQPGRPIHTGRAPDGTIIAGLPGNPVSVLATAHLFVWPIVRKMTGIIPSLPLVSRGDSPWRGEGSGVRALLPWEDRVLAEPVQPNPKRRAFRPVRVNADGSITVPAWAGSGDLAHTAQTDGLVALPAGEDEVRAGTAHPFLAWA